MATPITLAVSYGYVYGRLLSVAGDTSDDSNDKPDGIAAQGTVTFTPLVPIIATDIDSHGAIGIIKAETYSLDSDGIIRDTAGNSPMAFMCGQYVVTFSLQQNGATQEVPGFTMEVKPENTIDAPLDMAYAYPLIPNPTVKFVVNEQVYNDTLAASDAAAQSAQDAANTVSGMIVNGTVNGSGDLILTTQSGQQINAGYVIGIPGADGRVQTVVAGANISVDVTDPANPIISSTSAVSSVNTKIGAVVLDASDVGAYAKPADGIPSADMTTAVQTSLGKADAAYAKPAGGIPKADLASTVQTSLGKADTALQSAPVTSVNAKTGAVSLTASDVGASPSGAYVKPGSGIPLTDMTSTVQTSLGKADSAVQPAGIAGFYTKPGTGIPSTDMTSAVQTSLGKADSALQTAPVTSVNTQTGAVSITASSLGAYIKPGDGIPATDLTAELQTSLTNAASAVTGPVSSVAGHLATFADATGTVLADGGSPLVASLAASASPDPIAVADLYGVTGPVLAILIGPGYPALLDTLDTMAAVAASATAMAAVAASATARGAVEASSAAIPALAASPLAVVKSYTVTNATAATQSIDSRAGWVIGASGVNSYAYSHPELGFTIGTAYSTNVYVTVPQITGGTTAGSTDGAVAPVSRFVSSLTSMNSSALNVGITTGYGASNTLYIKWIPIGS